MELFEEYQGGGTGHSRRNGCQATITMTADEAVEGSYVCMCMHVYTQCISPKCTCMHVCTCVFTAAVPPAQSLTLVTVSNIGIRTNLMNPIWAVALVTLSLSMNGATGRPSDFSRSLCGKHSDNGIKGTKACGLGYTEQPCS